MFAFTTLLATIFVLFQPHQGGDGAAQAGRSESIDIEQLPSTDTDQLVPPPVPMRSPLKVTQFPDTVNLNHPCPVTSLYVLFHLSGSKVGFADILRQLDQPTREGIPASVLCQVAEHHGMPLDVVKLDEHDVSSFSGPWIAFLQPCAGVGSGVGHYVVIRPVSDGSKLQVIDPPQPPRIVPRTKLFEKDGWCRIALVPQTRRLNLSRWVFVAAGAAGCCFGMMWLRRIQRESRDQGNVRN